MSLGKTVLLAGGGYADIPMIKAAIANGCRVITSGNRPKDAGHSYSHEYYDADFSDPEAILDIAVSRKVDFVIPSCNDFSALSCSFVAEQLGLPGYDPLSTATTIHHKDQFRNYLQSTGLPSPASRCFDSKESALNYAVRCNYPLIVKPVDLTGGKGITKVEDSRTAKSAIESVFSISRESKVVLETFLEGSNHGFTSILRNGKVAFHFSDNEHYYLNKYLVAGASTPGEIPGSAIEELVAISEFIANDLNLVDGIFHVQFILVNDQPYIVEICRRPPGDLYVELVRHATGVNYPAAVVSGFTGESLGGLRQVTPKEGFVRHCIMGCRNGEVSGVRIHPEIEKLIIDSYMWWKSGSRIENYLVEKLGILFLKFPDIEHMRETANNLQDLVKVEFR